MQHQAARFVKSRYSRYSSVSDMLDVLGWTPLSQRRQGSRLILFFKIIKCPPKASLSRRVRVLEDNTTCMDRRFSLKLLVHGTGLLSLKLCHWLYLVQVFFKISIRWQSIRMFNRFKHGGHYADGLAAK